jgi:hypothetical protein
MADLLGDIEGWQSVGFDRLAANHPFLKHGFDVITVTFSSTSILAKVIVSSLVAAMTRTELCWCPRPRLSPPFLTPPLKKASSTWIRPASWYSASRASMALRILCNMVHAHLRPMSIFLDKARAGDHVCPSLPSRWPRTTSRAVSLCDA